VKFKKTPDMLLYRAINNYLDQKAFEILDVCPNLDVQMKIMAPILYFNTVKIISLIETDMSEARVAAQLGLPKS
jgi:hypothetical protein